MSGDGVAVPERSSPSGLARAARLLPGLALLFVIGYAGKWIEGSIKSYGKEHHLTLPNIEYVLWAIIIGLVVGLALMFVSGLRSVVTGLVLLIAYGGLCVVMPVYMGVMLPVLPGFAVILLTMIMAGILYVGPYKPLELESSPTYVAPSKEGVGNRA